MSCPHCGCPAGASSAPDEANFVRLDADFVRVIEDVIDTLIARNLINITDLPDQAQAKLFARRSFRDHLGRRALKLFEDSGVSSVVPDTNLGPLV
jgi:hypothetical protein